MLSSSASYRAVSLAAMLLAAACNDGGSGDSPPPPPPPPPTPAPALHVERVFPALTFTQPVAMLQAPGDATRWFVVEQTGVVRVFANTPQVSTSTVFADITDRVTNGGEMGLLGMAFHPDFSTTNRRVYLSYTNETGTDRFSRISQFELDSTGNLDRSSEVILLRIRQPEANHNGGQIAFGPDRLLYIGMGDGGSGNDPHGPIGNGQLMTTLLGKMLRINVIPNGYTIPPGNPFAINASSPCGAGGTGLLDCPEIFASGFRNPWRWSFDRNGGALWVGDVGQGAREEIDRVVVGGNLGWRCREGTLATGLPCGPAQNLLAPVAEYGRDLGASVTGGYVYRGTAIPGLVGRYVFGDFITGTLWHIAESTQPTMQMGAGFPIGLSISSFGEDVAGELYVVHYGGTLHRVRGP